MNKRYKNQQKPYNMAKKSKKRGTLTRTNQDKQERLNLHTEIIDQYFVNGFNGVQAVLAVKPDSDYTVASVIWQNIINSDRNKAYLDEKRARLRASTDIRNENVLRELINWAYVDATEFMTLNEEEIKELPADIRRCIQSFKVQEKRTIDRAGQEHVNKIIEIKLVDKQKSLELISKHIGFFSLDNQQKATKINLNKIDAETLNVLLQATEETE